MNEAQTAQYPTVSGAIGYLEGLGASISRPSDQDSWIGYSVTLNGETRLLSERDLCVFVAGLEEGNSRKRSRS